MNAQKKGWTEIPLGGACWISSTEYKTGNWRTYKPVWNTEKCVRCMRCHIYCPEGCVKHDQETNEMVYDFDYCKGCGICANECPAEAIEMILEEKK